jgi:conjugal transfer ATP-binding protein TraC
MKTTDLDRLFKDRDSFSEFLPWRIWDEGNQCFENADRTIGKAWELSPPPFAGETTLSTLKGILEMDFPEETVIQFILFADPRVEPILRQFARFRDSILLGEGRKELSPSRALARTWAGTYSKFLTEHVTEGFCLDVPVPVRIFRLFMAVKIPFLDYEATLRESQEKFVAIESTLRNQGMDPLTLTPGGLLSFVRYCLNPSYCTGHQGPEPYNPDAWLHRQVIRKDTEIHWKPSVREPGLVIDDYETGVYSVTSYPKGVSIQDTLELTGNIYRQNLEQIQVPFLVTLTFLNRNYNDRILARSNIIVAQKGVGSMSIRLEKKKQDFVKAVNEIEDNVRFKGFMISAITFSPDRKTHDKAKAILTNIWDKKGYKLEQEGFITLPVFISNLPFGLPNFKVTRDRLKRIEPAPVESIVHCLPIQADWRGIGGPAVLLVSRRGQLMVLDIFESDTNYNCAVAAESRAGKSFFINYILLSYLGLGAKIRIIDVGRSYEKLTGIVQGEFIAFDKKKDHCINPFSITKDIESDMELLSPMIQKMAKPSEGCTDLERGFLEDAIRRAWNKYGSKATVSRAAEMLMSEGDPRKKDLGLLLQPFGPGGQYSRWFEGAANVSTSDADLQVLEMEELNNDKRLRSIVLLFILYQLTQAVFFADRSVRKLFIIDEAWDLLGDTEAAGSGRFIEALYRKAGKYTASVITITQSIKDYYRNDSTEAILANAAFMFLLRQKAEEVDQAVRSGKLFIDDFLLDYIKSVHTIKGKYSEIYMKCGDTSGIGRLFVDPYTYALFTTDGDKVQFLQSLVEKGMTWDGAIRKAIVTDYGKETPA